MKTEVLADDDAVARRAAAFIALQAHDAVARRGKFTLAVSGGHTPWQMLRALADLPMPWHAVHIFQVDERVAPDDDPDRNDTHIRASLVDHIDLPPGNMHSMPVDAPDLDAAANAYARVLDALAGTPPVLDLVHLGLGPDGHTASLVPGDPVLDVTNAAVGVSGTYQGHRRLTLTYPTLDRARQILFVITGAEKAAMLARLLAGDRTIPAGRVNPAHALTIADRAAAGTPALEPGT